MKVLQITEKMSPQTSRFISELLGMLHSPQKLGKTTGR